MWNRRGRGGNLSGNTAEESSVGSVDVGVESALRQTRFPTLLAVLIVMSLLASNLGILPSPVLIARLTGGDLAARFPCEADTCGCFSALECWTQCCCLTPRQRLAWAIQNGVKPPAHAVLPAGDRGQSEKLLATLLSEISTCADDKQTTSGCCADDDAPTCASDADAGSGVVLFGGKTRAQCKAGIKGSGVVVLM